MPFKYKLLLIVSPLIVIFDQLSKLWILRTLPLGDMIPVIPGYFDIVHVRNTGAAFGFLAGSHAGFREPFFYLVALVAVAVMINVLRKLKPQDRLMPWVIALIGGGLVGNLIDRVRLGSVVDFVSFHWQDKVADWHLGSYALQFRWEWPAFNVADSAITTAMVLLVVHMLFFETRNPGR